MTKRIAIYHKDCADGTLAAACFLHKYPDAMTFPMPHSFSKSALDAILAHVDDQTDAYTLDCCIGMEELAPKAKSLTIIDHHEGVEASIASFAHAHPGVTVVYDKHHSGAALSWRHFFPNTTVPRAVDLVEDRDIWNNKFGEQSIAFWTYMMPLFDHPERAVPLLTSSLDEELKAGQTMWDFGKVMITTYRKNAAPQILHTDLGPVPMYNCSFADPLKSEFIHQVVTEHDGVVGTYQIKGNFVRMSFRSEDHHAPKNALAIAQRYGGSGHPNSSGASLSRKDFFDHLT